MISSHLKIGILGGGQLGKMLLEAKNDFQNCHFSVLDPNPDASCKDLADTFEVGDFKDFQSVLNFGKKQDVVTIEIENVNVDALCELQSKGVQVFPDPKIIRTVQDKGLQKEFYQEHQLPTSNFVCVKQASDYQGKYPVVQKLRVGGYDGQGVKIIKSPQDLPAALPGESIFEDCVDIAKELSIIVARDQHGHTKLFDLVEMQMDPELNLVDYLFAPADISTETIKTANDIAIKLASALNLIGILAIELFLTKDGEVLINEIAPRPHNSGHHSIEACYTSQYKQLLNCISGKHLENPALRTSAVMVNLLGEPPYSGPVQYKGIDDIQEDSDIHLHLYGKAETRPNRKMGHITTTHENLDIAKEKAIMARQKIRIIS